MNRVMLVVNVGGQGRGLYRSRCFQLVPHSVSISGLTETLAEFLRNRGWGVRNTSTLPVDKSGRPGGSDVNFSSDHMCRLYR